MSHKRAESVPSVPLRPAIEAAVGSVLPRSTLPADSSPLWRMLVEQDEAKRLHTATDAVMDRLASRGVRDIKQAQDRGRLAAQSRVRVRNHRRGTEVENDVDWRVPEVKTTEDWRVLAVDLNAEMLRENPESCLKERAEKIALHFHRSCRTVQDLLYRRPR